MPLIFQRHKPPELDQEIRALWARVDRLDRNAIAAGGVGTQGPPGPPGVSATGTVLTWVQKVEVEAGNYNDGAGNGIYSETFVLDSIAGAYTHAELVISVLQGADGLVSKWLLRGNVPFRDFREDDFGEHPTILPYPVHYDLFSITHPNNPTGRYFRIPEVWALATANKNVAYRPIVPASDSDSLRLEFELNRPGNPILCFKAWVMGRYVKHESVGYSTQCPAL